MPESDASEPKFNRELSADHSVKIGANNARAEKLNNPGSKISDSQGGNVSRSKYGTVSNVNAPMMKCRKRRSVSVVPTMAS